MKPSAAFVRAQCRVELHAVSAVHLDLVLVLIGELVSELSGAGQREGFSVRSTARLRSNNSGRGHTSSHTMRNCMTRSGIATTLKALLYSACFSKREEFSSADTRSIAGYISDARQERLTEYSPPYACSYSDSGERLHIVVEVIEPRKNVQVKHATVLQMAWTQGVAEAASHWQNSNRKKMG